MTTRALQREHYLRMLETHIRTNLHETYPNGPPTGKTASWLLSNGEGLVAALRRIEAGTYGICAGCGREISLIDLWATPEVRHCRYCRLDRGEADDRPRDFVI